MKTYEYKILEVPATDWFWGGKIDTQALTNRLNNLGKEGWLVTAMNGTNMWRGASRSVFVVLRREI